ncbi:methyltransferase [Mycolicibacterium mengxianglii]|uniref:methyltransferase n=1 Tax=Mycolicibacterium mengxianglii TaxID=2736649 RepID=UPI0018D1D63B|nr:methyltransferase [Mycolicibacterium mengxianglii]
MVYEDDGIDHRQHVYRLIMAAWGSQAIRALADCSIAEHLKTEALTAQQIAERERVDASMLYRLLRVGVSMGLLNHDTDSGTFLSTAMLQMLHEDAPDSLKHYAKAAIGPAFWLPAVRTPQAIATGRNQAVEALGTSVFDYFGQHPEEARVFTAAMTDLSTPVIREAVSAIDVGNASYAIDVGGADGTFVSELLERHPELTGAVLDLPHVIPSVVDNAKRRGISHRMAGIGGDFLESVPSADIYLLKFVLHDWDDRTCITLLGNIRRAMNPSARLFIVEMVHGYDVAALDTALMDMAMLFSNTGKERDVSEFESLLSEAGLCPVTVRPLRGSYHVIEATADQGD